jgi:HTH-type transcriptional regulator / antitoxin HipB
MKKSGQSTNIDQAPHPKLVAIGEQLKAAREAKGMSQRALSARTGLPQSHISQIENAAIDLRITSLVTVAHALDLELTLISRRLVSAVEGLQRQASQSQTKQIPAYRLDEEEEDA